MASRFDSGDHKVLESVFNEHYRALWHFTNSFIHDRWEAEDIVVETFLKLWKLRVKFGTDQAIKAFLYITARNACFNYLKHEEVRRFSHKELLYLNGENAETDLEHLVHTKIIESDILREILHEIKSLPPKMKQIFEMIFMHDLSTGEISRKLNLSQATVRVQKARAVKALKVKLIKKGLTTY